MERQGEALWRALQPLRSVACWLMTGAHPDDEWSGFLAWLALGRGVRTEYACATRGEGGQNALGPDRGAALGALRSREMECAAAELGLGLHWLGAGPAHGADDPIVDFGFSRSGEDTLARWGEVRLLERLVRLIRTLRPDALSPTFLDVPGQHGHHRAVTRCTLRAAALAADPAWTLGHADLPAWQVAKVYLPAFSGAGGSYDDQEPPPPETVRVDLGAPCPALGASWADLGERSRRCHASQGMGRDLPPGPRPFPLHLHAGPADRSAPLDGVPHSLADLAGLLAPGPAAQALRQADGAIAAALAAFPDAPRIATALHDGLAALAALALPAGADDIARRVARKRRELGRAAALALGISAEIALAPPTPRAGDRVRVSITVRGPATAQVRWPEGWHVASRDGHALALDIPAAAAPFGTLRDGHDPLGGNDPLGATLAWRHAGSDAALAVDPPDRLVLGPMHDVVAMPQCLVRRSDSPTPAVVTLTGTAAPPDWPIRARVADAMEIDAAPGLTVLSSAGTRLAATRHAHVGRVALVVPASAAVLRTPVAIDAGARVGVVAGESDETLDWLRQLDIAAEALDDAALATGDLGRFTTLLIGIAAFGQRPALRAQRHRLLAWCAAGGSLVTLYHRPGDGWDEGRTPPHRLVIGSPSLRWRVTDPAAPVTVLAPGHPLLRHPNRIAPADWDGWVRERGLYFACEWDGAYAPLLELADPGEPPLRGGLLAAPVGRGRHVHVALALHHQFSALVPGAFRLLANLVARPPHG